MVQKEKLIKRLQSNPKDFSFDEAETLLKHFGYTKYNKGKTSGSRTMFICQDKPSILLHKPHPRKNLLAYQIKQLINILEQEELL